MPSPNVAPTPVPEGLAAAGARSPEIQPAPAQQQEAAAQPGPAANAGQPVASPTQQSAVDPMAMAMGQVPVPAAGDTPAATPGPGVADDVDVIEPEWVEKVEEVVKTHQGDPYGEEEAFEELQEDYLQKRYGLTVKEPDSDSPKSGPK
jgi:hypothetical protein